MKTITRERLQELIERNAVVLLEALPPMHFSAEHLPGARNLPLDDLDEVAAVVAPDKAATVVTYCTGTTCANSKIAAGRLEALGYTDVRAYEGGKEEWIAAGLAVEATSARAT
ncbi:MAG: rhodanese-like domain-containing protein [Acidimicrobiales bacterium]